MRTLRELKLLVVVTAWSGCNLFSPTTTVDQTPDAASSDVSLDSHVVDNSNIGDDASVQDTDTLKDMTDAGAPDLDPGPDLGSPVDTAPDVEPDDWWDAAWTRRVAITVGATASGAAETNVPVLVQLDDTRWDGNPEDGLADVRFIAADHVTLLPHEVDGGNFWVRIPTIGATARMWMYYGNPAAPDGSQPAAVWDNGFVAVWHFEDLEDATGYGNDFLAAGGTSSVEFLGQAAEFGPNVFRLAPDAPSFHDSVDEFTVSAWFVHNRSQAGYAAIAARGFGNGGFNDFWLGLYDDQVMLDMYNGSTNQSLRGPAIPATRWTHVTATFGGGARHLYVDGVFTQLDTFGGSMAQTAGPVIVGADSNNGGASHTDWFDGAIDELRVSSVRRSADWVDLQYRSMTDDLLTYEPVETR